MAPLVFPWRNGTRGVFTRYVSTSWPANSPYRRSSSAHFRGTQERRPTLPLARVHARLPYFSILPFSLDLLTCSALSRGGIRRSAYRSARGCGFAATPPKRSRRATEKAPYPALPRLTRAYQRKGDASRRRPRSSFPFPSQVPAEQNASALVSGFLTSSAGEARLFLACARARTLAYFKLALPRARPRPRLAILSHPTASLFV